MNHVLKKSSLLFIATFVMTFATACSKNEKEERGSVVVQVPEKNERQVKENPRPSMVHKDEPKKVPAARSTPARTLPAGHPPVAGHNHAGHDHAGHAHAGHAPHGKGYPTAGTRKLPVGHPPIGSKRLASPPSAHTGPLPLLKRGPGSEAELKRINVTFQEGADRDAFDQAFRQVFTVQRRLRNPAGAVKSLEALQPKYPKSAAIYRVLGYAAVDHGFQHQLAMKHYKKAIELDPEYGEVHYALAFMYVIGSEKAKGGAHYTKSVELGIQDNRNIGKRFYPDLVK